MYFASHARQFNIANIGTSQNKKGINTMSFEISEYEGYEVKVKGKKIVKGQLVEKSEETEKDGEDNKKED